jgi:protein phosphatase
VNSWRFAAATDVGLVREVNEDAIATGERLAVIADGMGGHAAGEVASAIAVGAIEETFASDPSESGLIRAFAEANRRIVADAIAHPERHGMGTTVVAAALVEDAGDLVPVIVNVGDSRAYQLRDGAMRQLTLDHSVAEEWVRQGRLTPEEAAVHPRRHQITRTLGLEDAVEADVFAVDIHQGDRLLLCSDGLSNELSDEEIADLASEPHDLDSAVSELVELANRRGGRDNISVVVLEFDVSEPAPSADAPVFAAAFVPPTFEELTGGPAAGSVDVLERVAAEPERTQTVPVVAPRVDKKTRRKRVSWRMILFVTLLGSLIGFGVVVVQWYSSQNYFLANDRGYVAIYQGQPNGVLWVRPQLVMVTGFSVHKLLPSDQFALATESISVRSIPGGLAKINYLYHSWYLARFGPPPSTTTTTTTTTTLFGGGG